MKSGCISPPTLFCSFNVVLVILPPYINFRIHLGYPYNTWLIFLLGLHWIYRSSWEELMTWHYWIDYLFSFLTCVIGWIYLIPKIFWSSICQGVSIWRWGHSELIRFIWGHEGAAPIMGLISLQKEMPENSPSLCHVRIVKTGSSANPGEGSPEPNHAST